MTPKTPAKRYYKLLITFRCPCPWEKHTSGEDKVSLCQHIAVIFRQMEGILQSRWACSWRRLIQRCVSVFLISGLICEFYWITSGHWFLLSRLNHDDKHLWLSQDEMGLAIFRDLERRDTFLFYETSWPLYLKTTAEILISRRQTHSAMLLLFLWSSWGSVWLSFRVSLPLALLP